jgi:hypothetical protein
MDRAENLRGQLASALSDIPEKLKNVREILKIHHHSIRLRLFADGIFVAIFGLLEVMVDELSKSWLSRRLSIRGKDHV